MGPLTLVAVVLLSPSPGEIVIELGRPREAAAAFERAQEARTFSPAAKTERQAP